LVPFKLFAISNFHIQIPIRGGWARSIFRGVLAWQLLRIAGALDYFMRIRRLKDCRGRPARLGFTLMEVLVATAVIGLVFTALYSGITSCFFSIRLARENLRATQIMLEKMEVIRLLTWSQVNSNGFLPGTFKALYDPNSPDPSKALSYEGTIVVTNIPLSVNYKDDLRLVTVRLTWNTDRLARTREMSTYVSRYGVHNYLFR